MKSLQLIKELPSRRRRQSEARVLRVTSDAAEIDGLSGQESPDRARPQPLRLRAARYHGAPGPRDIWLAGSHTVFDQIAHFSLSVHLLRVISPRSNLARAESFVFAVFI